MNTPLITSVPEMYRAEGAAAHGQSDPKGLSAIADAPQATDAQHPPPSATGQYPLSRYTWYVIFLLSTVNAFNYMDRMALSILAPAIKADLNLTDTQVGLLTGLAFALFYAICGIPIARWADRGNRRNIITLAITVWSAMTALSGTAQHFWHLFLVRMGIGAGEAGGLTPSHSMICDYVPLKRRSMAFAIQGFGPYVGIMLGMALAGWLSEIIGWRWTFVALGLPGIALAAVVRLTLREPERGRLDEAEGENMGLSLLATMIVLWRCRTYRLLLLSAVVGGFAQMGFYQWLPSFYTRSLELSLSSAGGYIGIAMGLGSAIGMITGGLAADKASRRNIGLPLRLGAVTVMLALPAACGTLLVSSAVSSLLLLSLTVLLWCLPGGAVGAALYSVTMPRMRSTAGAISIFATSAVGFGLGPFCVGLLSDFLASSLGAAALRYAMLAPLGLTLVSATMIYAAGRALPSDLRAAGSQAGMHFAGGNDARTVMSDSASVSGSFIGK